MGHFKNPRWILSFISVFISAGVFGVACQKTKGEFFAAALGLDKDRILVASQLATTLNVTSYDLDGNFLGILADYQAEVNGPRGLVLFDELHALLSLEGDDRLDLINYGGGYSNFLQGSLLTGAIGKMTKNPSGTEIYIIEATNTIERFSLTGERIPVTGNAFVTGALAPCAAPASLRTIVFNNAGRLIALQSGAATGFIYTVGNTTASACTAIAALPTNVNDVINHSDGNLYWVGTNSQVYRASQTMTGSTSIFNNTATINTPTAIAELPNGDLLIASDTTDSLEVISTTGVYRGTFHKGTNTQQVHSLLVVPGQ